MANGTIEEPTPASSKDTSKDIGHHDGDWCSRRDHVYCFRDSKNGKLHREGGPAMKTTCGDERWYYNGVLHRPDGPAIIRADGTKEWFRNGIRHREQDSGPAVEYASGAKEYWVYGQYRPDEDFPRFTAITNTP